ncbi:MAG TPA: pyridoxal-5'-phosphate-dependent protein, partial [Novosphingobium sp.]|nr:pyridoxal-5'-phosphate-dependent protein [Novosphingobium sp.]
ACDALQTPATRPINFAVLKGRVPRGLVVTPAEVRAAQRWAFANLHLVVEPGGAAALAAVLAGKTPIDGRTVMILSGGNTDPQAFATVLSRAD